MHDGSPIEHADGDEYLPVRGAPQGDLLGGPLPDDELPLGVASDNDELTKGA